MREREREREREKERERVYVTLHYYYYTFYLTPTHLKLPIARHTQATSLHFVVVTYIAVCVCVWN